MKSPIGKGLYARNPILYPNRDPAGYAKEMRCSFIAFFHDKTNDDHILRAHDLGLQTFLYSHGYDHWHPTTWKRELYEQTERAQRLNMRGFIADVENAPAWLAHKSQVQPLIDDLRSAAYTLPSVGFTSFPSWPYMKAVAAEGAPLGLWGSPQLYGVVSPGGPAELERRAVSWREAFGGDVIPSLAAWARPPDEQTAYMDHFHAERGAILWQSENVARPGSQAFAALADWQPYGRGSFANIFARSTFNAASGRFWRLA